MKKMMTAVFALAALAVSFQSPAASADEMILSQEQVLQLFTVNPLDLINWKVGDTMNYNVGMASFGNVGTSVKTVNKDEGTSLWLHQTISLMGQNQTVDAQINKADGKILKLIQNGQEQAVPNDPMTVISQDYTEITVAAGTFKCVHVVAKTQQVSKIEVWANPQATCMDGALKQIMATQMGDLTMELTSFKKM